MKRFWLFLVGLLAAIGFLIYLIKREDEATEEMSDKYLRGDKDTDNP